MTTIRPEREALRRLGETIDEALGLCDGLALGRIGCHLQMARDLLGEEAWRPSGVEIPTPPWPCLDESDNLPVELP